jgi:uncharacterized protein
MSRITLILDADTEGFWTAGRDGKLKIHRCNACQRYSHPPRPICAYCHSRDVYYAEVTGRGELLSFTVNVQPWEPDLAVPYVIGVVGLDEDVDVHITANVSADPDQVYIGMRVQVGFERSGDIWYPQFRPVET